jgi:hypothetical protein
MLWSFGGGDVSVIDFVRDRSGVTYVAFTPSGASVYVAALDPEGTEKWRTALAEPGPVSLVASGAGDIWIQGQGLTRMNADGAIAWTSSLPAWKLEAHTLAPDGTYVHIVATSDSHLALESIGGDGTAMWNTPLGGNTNGTDVTPVSTFAPPIVDSSGNIEVACQPCSDGRTGIAEIDRTSGALVNVFGVGQGTSDNPTADDQGNIYFETISANGGLIVSADASGNRWTSAHSWLPTLLGSDSVSLSGFLDLSRVDGTVVHSGMPASPTIGYGALQARIAGDLRMLAATFAPPGSFGASGTLIADDNANSVWSETGMIASTAIPDAGRVLGLEPASSGAVMLVALAAPITGLDSGPWPMVSHDPGRTNSVAATW